MTIFETILRLDMVVEIRVVCVIIDPRSQVFISHTRWVALEEGGFKHNIDREVFNGLKLLGMRGVIQNHDGIIFVAISHKFTIAYSLEIMDMIAVIQTLW